MEHLGIPEHMAAGDVVRPHWPGLKEYLTKLAQQGLPLPPGIDPQKTYSEYTLEVRKKKGVLED
jgi:hypothetical protein